MPTKIYRIKMNDFWINVSYTSPFSKITETAPFPPRRRSDISIALHSNSIAGYVIMFTIGLLQTYCEHDYGSRY